MNDINQIGKSVVEVIKSELSFSKLIDNIEIGVGVVARDPISILKGLNKSIETGGNITNLLFYTKLQGFLKNVSEIPYEKRIKFINKYMNGRENEFSRKIIEEIDSINDSEKIYFIANSFKAMVDEKIDINTFYRVVHIIRSLIYEDLMYLKDNIDKKEIVANTNVFALTNVGLMYQSVLDANASSRYDFLDLAYQVVEYSLTWGDEKIDGHYYKKDTKEEFNTKVKGAKSEAVFG